MGGKEKNSGLSWTDIGLDKARGEKRVEIALKASLGYCLSRHATHTTKVEGRLGEGRAGYRVSTRFRERPFLLLCA